MVRREPDKRGKPARDTVDENATSHNRSMKRQKPAPRLLADIGGTYARFAVQFPGADARKLRRYRCTDFSDILSAVRTYFRDAKVREPLPATAAIAVAAPIIGDHVHMTNHPWSFSIESMRQALGFETLIVVNDFLAIAESIPHLRPDQRRQIGGKRAIAHAPIAVIGPGTGLGIGALIPDEDGQWHAIATEGGHATMAANDEHEAAVIREIRHHHRHVSAERCLSGRGLINLYRALATLEQAEVPDLAPPEITRRAQQGNALARQAVAMFTAMLGSAAGNLALVYGAVGGVYIAGGIVPKIGDLFNTRLFRRRFTDKGRYRRYLAPIPTYVIIHPLPALIGLAALLDRRTATSVTIRQ